MLASVILKLYGAIQESHQISTQGALVVIATQCRMFYPMHLHSEIYGNSFLSLSSSPPFLWSNSGLDVAWF